MEPDLTQTARAYLEAFDRFAEATNPWAILEYRARMRRLANELVGPSHRDLRASV